MNAHWHEQIQRCLAGDSTPDEIAALQQALKDDAELRALYLDYINLDAALGAAATINEDEPCEAAEFPRPLARPLPHRWHWLAATATCAALVLLMVLPGHRKTSPPHPDLAAAVSSTKSAIARLSVEPATAFPTWMSPTASLLDPPALP